MHPIFASNGSHAVPIHVVTPVSLRDIAKAVDALAYAKATGFQGKPGQGLLVPGTDGALAAVLVGDSSDDPFAAGRLAALLPSGTYRFATAPSDARLATLAIALAAYEFTRYRKSDGNTLKLVPPDGVDAAELSAVIEGVTLTRDLVNTPSNDMGPAELETAARKLARTHRARIAVTSGRTLAREFPLVQAVGQGSARTPRVIDMTWGNPKHPKVTLVGKGVCFDTGGLDIKSDAGMLNMKKDMGGAATALGLAHMLMARKVQLRLRVIIPAVENSISGASFRPRDIYRSRKGITVEIGNTDAEGRLVLADALALADEEKPELIVDFATLTGAARVALGPELPPFYTDDDALAAELMAHGIRENDPVWRLPLWRPYDAMLESKIADTNNVGGSFAGSITAALFLRKFVENAKAWLHLDIFAWTPTARPGRPEGGECQTARALYALLKKRYT
jgi:leucyl aminopeptidase